MGIYSTFFSQLNTISNIEDYKKLLKDKVETFTKQNYWELFGYVYFGIFAWNGIKRLQILELPSIAEGYVRDIFEAAYFDEQKDVVGNELVVAKILKGREEFLAEGKHLKLSSDSAIRIQKEVIQYLNDGIIKYDECQLLQLYKQEKVGEQIYHIPLNRTGRMHIGIINPWPGDLSAESEVLTRINKTAEEVGIKCTLLSDWGHILRKDDQKKTDQFVVANDLDFVITTHYVTPKTLDAFYYHALWNPPEIPLNLGEYTQYVTNNYLMNDDYLTYDMGGMKNHLLTILMNKPRSIESTSMLTASFPESAMLEPTLENPKMFYCGMNWDKLVNHQNRHEGLFKLLDKTGNVKFFGPDVMKNWGGIRPWEGYKCYKYPIPWDGFSILNEINQCGICLVLSSDIHRRAGAVTNRAYEACAAGAIMISDNNEFMQKHFKDAALFIYYNRNDPLDTFQQIMDKYNWVLNHKEEALEMVRRAQNIFKEKFALDKQLLRIVSNHAKRFLSIQNDLFAKDDGKRVLVTYVLNSLEETDIKNKLFVIIKNIKRQYYANLKLVIAADTKVEDFVRKYLYTNYTEAECLSVELFDKKGIRCMTDGQAIRIIQNTFDYTYYVNISAREVWFYDHITTLVRTIEDNQSYGAYSGRLFLDSGDRYTRADYFNVYSDAELSSVSDVRAAECPGEFLFTKEANKYLPDFLFDSLDGLEHYAYMNILQIRNNLPISFSRRMTDIDNGDIYDDRKVLINYGMQVRLIQDIIRFELKSKRKGGENLTFNPLGQIDPGIVNIVKDILLKIPLKRWAKYKWHLAMARKYGYDSKLGKKHVMKVESLRNAFFEYWN